MRKYLLLTIALLLFLNVDAQLKRSAVNPTHLPPMSLVKPTPVVAEAKMAEPGYAVKKAPQRDSAPSIYYRRPPVRSLHVLSLKMATLLAFSTRPVLQ